MITMEEKRFTEFRKLYQSVAKLIRCQSYLDDVGSKAVAELEALARKMEVSYYIQKRDTIAIAGMQGSGKSTLIKNIYGLPKDILSISSERGEKIPVFLTEKEHLKPAEYEAKAVYYENGEKQEKFIDISEIKTHSRRGNAAYLEVFVPYQFFYRDNAGFVLLPGFEKDQDRSFNKDYNSLMEYTLHFANAVILVTDNVGIANEEIDSLVELLGLNFSPTNCVFAITKCEDVDEEECEELRVTLSSVCKERQLKIGLNQIVCVGDYDPPSKHAIWVDKLMDTVGDNVDYNADKKDYTYFKPMLEEMLRCTKRLEEQMDTLEYRSESSSPLYLPLKKALEEAESRLENKMDLECENTQKIVSKAFAKAFDGIDNKQKKKKKLLFFNKSFSDLERDRDVIEQVCLKCLKDEMSGKSLFITNVGKSLTNGEERKRLCEVHNNMSLQCVSSDSMVVTAEQRMQYINESARFYLDASVQNLPMLAPELHVEEKAIAGLIATEFEGFFLGSLAGDMQLEKVQIRSSSVAPALKHVAATKNKNWNPATIITMADLLDGKPDILESVVSLFVKDSEKVGDIVSAGCGAAAVAIAVVAASKKGIAAYNESVRAQNTVGEAWKYALLNAVEEQKNSCLDSFHQAGEKLLEHLDEVHRMREHIGDIQRRITEARYAISDIRSLVNQINDKYAASLEAR